MFTEQQLEVVRFCAVECRLQGPGEESVWRMLRAWNYAIARAGSARDLTVGDVQRLGYMIEPDLNPDGFRTCDVRVGSSVKMPWELVPKAMDGLLEDLATDGATDPAGFFRSFEEIHPFRDGNGRTGQILFNWLNGTLENPVWAPDFWGDPRRVEGAGA